MIPVTVFNASALSIAAGFNNPSTMLTIGGTNGNLDWIPQSAPAGAVSLAPTGPPGPNLLATGLNTAAIVPLGTTQPVTFPVTLPASVNWRSAQFYIFYNKNGNIAWLLLNDGQPVASCIP